MHHCLLHTEKLLDLELDTKLRQLRLHQAGDGQQLMRAMRIQLPGMLQRISLHHLSAGLLHGGRTMRYLQLLLPFLRRGQQHF
jgi:hypothetical protein